MDMMRFHSLSHRLYSTDLQSNGEALLKEFYDLWCEAQQSGIDQQRIADEADDCLHRIATTELFTLAACEWIGKEGHYSISKALIHPVGVRYLQHPQLVRFDLSNASASFTTSVARRLCALDAPVPVALGWVLSMNEDYPASPQISKTTTLVTGFLTAEYPATCRRLLEAEGSAFGDSPIARETFEKLVIDINALEALPHLTELQMPSDMRRSFRYRRRDDNRAVTEQVRSRSIFEPLMTPQHFKYSTKVAFEYQNGQETIDAMIPMFTHEVSAELPQTWVAGPLLYNQKVMNLWNEADE